MTRTHRFRPVRAAYLPLPRVRRAPTRSLAMTRRLEAAVAGLMLFVLGLWWAWEHRSGAFFVERP